jgi:hypothetical protein
MKHSILSLLVLLCLSACSANLPQIAQTAGDALGRNDQAQMVRAIKETLELSSTRASDLLSQTGGYSQHPLYRITLPEHLQPIAGRLRQFGLGGQLDRVELLMNQGAERAAVEARAVFIAAVRDMTVTDALGIIRGHDTAATDYFIEHTEMALRQRYQPIIEQSLRQIGFYDHYQTLLSAYQQLPISNKPDMDLEQHVLTQSLNALFSQVAQEEKLIRQDPVGRGSRIIEAVFR